MVSSGTTAIATTGATATDVIAASAVNSSHNCVEIVNEGPAGFFSIDGGNTWSRIPAAGAINRDGITQGIRSVKIKRDGATNMTGVYATIWDRSR